MDDEAHILSKTKSQHSFRAGIAAVFIVSVLIIIKSYAYYASDSVSVLSSLVDSILDSIVSIVALGSIYYASRPADDDHRWGHGKMEAVSALFQSAIIVGGAAFLLFEAVDQFYDPKVVQHHVTGITVMAISTVLSIVLVMIQRYALARSGSLAVEADSVHYGSDVLINLGTIIVLVLGVYGFAAWVDTFYAVGVALFMVVLARTVACKSLDMLMDKELSEEDRAKIIACLENHDGVLGWHDLRTRRNGAEYVVTFDIEVQADLTLWAAHEIAKDVEEDILELYPNADILIHIDPEGYTEDSRHRVKGVHI